MYSAWFTTCSGYCVGRIRFVFSIPKPAINTLFPPMMQDLVPAHLAYVEWFSPFNTIPPGRDHGMYKISKLKDTHGQQKASVVPVSSIRQSVHLIPVFGSVAPAEWRSSNVLDHAEDFLVNSFTDRFQYCTLI